MTDDRTLFPPLDMIFQPDCNDLYIVDSGRNEVVIVRNCSIAMDINKAWINLFKQDGVKSVCFHQGNTVCLYRQKGEQMVDIFDITLPSARKSSLLVVEGKRLKK